jgi:acyl carrier protein
MNEVKSKLRQIILAKFLPGESEEALTDDLMLMESGILNSMAIIYLVSYIENEFEFDMEAKDIVGENFSTINSIANLIERRSAEEQR